MGVEWGGEEVRCGVAVPGFAVADCAGGCDVGGGVEWGVDFEGGVVGCYCAGGAEDADQEGEEDGGEDEEEFDAGGDAAD